MSPGNLDHNACPAVREVLSRVGDKWSVQVIAMLGERPKRFNELRRTIEGISQRMLTLTLRGLERDGLVLRTVHPTVPPSVEYALTDLARTLLEPIRGLAAWAAGNRVAIHAARAKFDGVANSAAPKRATSARAGASAKEARPHGQR